MYILSDYEYDLPENLIAQEPAKPADHAKLLRCTIGENGDMNMEDKHFFDLPNIIGSDSVIFLNNSKVIKARIPLKNIHITRNYLPEKDTQKHLLLVEGEIFIYKILSRESNEFEALVSDGKHFKPGTDLQIDAQHVIKSLEFVADGIRMQLIGGNLQEFLEQYAELPLPPYITYNQKKESDYQNVFATQLGSVAAPTAGLHFTSSLLSSLETKGIMIEHVTLHVGLGTFKPIEKEDIKEHRIHSETAYLDPEIFHKIAHYKIDNRPIISVGTTVTRTLESLPYLRVLCRGYLNIEHDTVTTDFRDNISNNITTEHAQNIIARKVGTNTFDTRLYISPGYELKIIDSMITNFHLPRTTLLIMISTIMGHKNWKQCYEHAISQNYKFYSFGDAMMIEKAGLYNKKESKQV